jgi:hypothetical protein
VSAGGAPRRTGSPSRRWKTYLILGATLLAVGFALGFIPQYRHASEAAGRLQTCSAELSSCQFAQRLAVLRDLAALAFLEASRKNYGLAADHASRFFTEVERVLPQTTEERLRSSLQELLQRRDSITAGLARGDTAVLEELQTQLLSLYTATRP